MKSYLVVGLAIGLLCVWNQFQGPVLPAHLLNHPIIDRPDFLSEEMTERLLQMSRDLGSIPSVLRDTDSYKVKRSHIGEAEPFDHKLNRCPKPFLIRSGDECIFPGRIDVGKHFVMVGGVEGLKERYDKLVARVQPFIKYIFNYTEFDVAKELFESKDFTQLAKSVCPSDKQGVLDYFQFNLVLQVPGQSVATHIDAPVFYHANRFEFPQWLLASMVFSGLFQEDFAHQVQVVTYFHKWKTAEGGEFYFWDDNSGVPKKAFPASRSANSVDGSKTVHAAAVYQPRRSPPILSSTATNELTFNKKSGQWDVVSDGNVVASYEESELRFGAVYRARCFKDEDDLKAFRYAQDNQWSLDEVLNRFRHDLRSKGVYREGLSPYELGLLIMNTYVKYPMPNKAWIPFNYCALDQMFPWMSPILEHIC